MKITKLETFLVKPRWLFLKMHTDDGRVGLGEPILEGRALTVAQAVAELEPYLIGQDPTRVVYHWQAMYKHAFYRGGPLLTSALSGVEQAMWDLTGKALGVPVYKLMGGPLRNRIKALLWFNEHPACQSSVQQLGQVFSQYRSQDRLAQLFEDCLDSQDGLLAAAAAVVQNDDRAGEGALDN